MLFLDLNSKPLPPQGSSGVKIWAFGPDKAWKLGRRLGYIAQLVQDGERACPVRACMAVIFCSYKHRLTCILSHIFEYFVERATKLLLMTILNSLWRYALVYRPQRGWHRKNKKCLVKLAIFRREMRFEVRRTFDVLFSVGNFFLKLSLSCWKFCI